MLTIFSIPKAMDGHFGVIQRNAVSSWARLTPPSSVLLFGDEDGVGALAADLGVTHVPEVSRNDWGTPRVDRVFEATERHSTDRLLLFVNADVILGNDLTAALTTVDGWSGGRPFLMVGRRTNVTIDRVLDLDDDGERAHLTGLATQGEVAPPTFIDYFAFRRGTFSNIPPFAVGRPYYDNWLVWRAWRTGAQVIDATGSVTALHQNHDYSHAGRSRDDVYTSDEADRNLELTGGWQHLLTIEHAPFVLTGRGVVRNTGARRSARADIWKRRLIDWSRPVRHLVGLRTRVRDVTGR